MALVRQEEERPIWRSDAFTLYGTRLEITGTPSYEEWELTGQWLYALGNASTWAIGDWLAYGEGRGDWGEMYSQAVDLTKKSYQTLRDATWVSRRFQLSRRRDNLSWSHHKEVAALEPAKADALLDQAEANGWSHRDLREAVRDEKVAVLDERLRLPDAKYRVVYADPPWSYHDKAEAGAIQAKGAGHHYPTMTVQELCDMDIKGICEPDAVLFVWVTSPLLFECAPVINAWGFTYKASFVWDKVKHNMGHYNSVRHELLLLCGRGSCVPVKPTLYDSVQEIERGGHSEKPERFREIIDALYPTGKRIELFARKPAAGWDVWGNDVD